jgi:RNA polymerase subunit RPABC4/transcription elongation factor Spt4
MRLDKHCEWCRHSLKEYSSLCAKCKQGHLFEYQGGITVVLQPQKKEKSA